MRLGRLSRPHIFVALSIVGAVLLAGLSAAAAAVLWMQPLGLQAQYYRGLHGSAVPMLVPTEPILTAVDWRPDTSALKSHRSAVPAELFTATWDGFILVGQDRLYRFQLESDDGPRLYIDGILVIDNWGQHEVRVVEGERALNAGHHRIRIEYQQALGQAQLELRWDGAAANVIRPIEPDEVSTQRPTPYAGECVPSSCGAAISSQPSGRVSPSACCSCRPSSFSCAGFTQTSVRAVSSPP